MSFYTRVLAGVVVETLTTTGPAPQCHPDAGEWLNADSAAPVPAVNWTYAAKVYAAPAVPAPTLAGSQVTASAAAQVYYGGLIAAGFTSGGVLYAIDAASLAKVTAAGLAAVATTTPGSEVTWPSGFVYPSATGALQSLTAAQMLLVANNLFHYVAACDANFGSINIAIASAETIVAAEAIDVSAGYPGASA